VRAELDAEQEGIGAAPADAGATDPRVVLARVRGYLRNNAERMKYPEYRKAGLPVTSSWVESLIKEINYRVKGTEKFWNEDGAERILAVRAAALSASAAGPPRGSVADWIAPGGHSRWGGTVAWEPRWVVEGPILAYAIPHLKRSLGSGYSLFGHARLGQHVDHPAVVQRAVVPVASSVCVEMGRRDIYRPGDVLVACSEDENEFPARTP
jgi:hypothetical protein